MIHQTVPPPNPTDLVLNGVQIAEIILIPSSALSTPQDVFGRGYPTLAEDLRHFRGMATDTAVADAGCVACLPSQAPARP